MLDEGEKPKPHPPEIGYASWEEMGYSKKGLLNDGYVKDWENHKMYVKYEGLRVVSNFNPFLFQGKPESEFEEMVKVYPEYIVDVDDDYYCKLGITLILFRREDKKWMKKDQICILCDGPEYQIGEEAIVSDNEIPKELKDLGWKVIRFSNSDIHENSGEKFSNILQRLYEKTGFRLFYPVTR